MTKKSILVLSTLLASATLVGATFAAYAITDNALPFGVNITPGQIEEDTSTNYATLSWGESTTKRSDISNAVSGGIYKLGVYSLVSTKNYTGVLSVTLTDETPSRPENQERFIDYLQLYLYDGATGGVEEGNLPEGDYLLRSAVGATSMVYNSAQGTPSGKEYSIYIKVDSSITPYIADMDNDIVDISINWDAKATDIDDTSKTVYFSSDWENAYIFTWSDKGCNATYPGKKMTKIGINQYGQSVYQGLLLSAYDKMIFSNGGQGSANQTPDLYVSDFDFSEGDLLFWKDDSDEKHCGHKVFASSDVTSQKVNMASNPGPILQAWGWTTEYVRSNLANIKNAGYKAVQISPLQPVSYSALDWSNENWNLVYRPNDLIITPKDSNRNPFGDAYTLAQLTHDADEQGIDIIVDVVTNHLVNNSSIPTRGSDYLANDDGNLQKIVRGNLGTELPGLPDLQTDNSAVQTAVINMLKSYIDCGVSGFRFDAAKHIETPTDWDYASEFWPNIIGAINQYGLERLGKAPYSYGEIIGIGAGRDWSGYTKYIDVTDYSGVVCGAREEFNGHNAANAVARTGNYLINNSADYAVIFSETHDNYVGNETNNSVEGDGWQNLQYAYHASRANASSVYFARPAESNRVGNDTKIIVTPCDGYKSSIVCAANKLHNDFAGGSEYLSCWGSCVINARNLGSDYGFFVADVGQGDGHWTGSQTIKVACEGGYIPHGTYRNLQDNSTINITGDEFSCPISNGGAAFVLVHD